MRRLWHPNGIPRHASRCTARQASNRKPLAFACTKSDRAMMNFPFGTTQRTTPKSRLHPVSGNEILIAGFHISIMRHDHSVTTTTTRCGCAADCYVLIKILSQRARRMASPYSARIDMQIGTIALHIVCSCGRVSIRPAADLPNGRPAAVLSKRIRTTHSALCSNAP